MARVSAQEMAHARANLAAAQALLRALAEDTRAMTDSMHGWLLEGADALTTAMDALHERRAQLEGDTDGEG